MIISSQVTTKNIIITKMQQASRIARENFDLPLNKNLQDPLGFHKVQSDQHIFLALNRECIYVIPKWGWNFFCAPTRKLLKQQNQPAFLRHSCSDSICNSHPDRINLRIESMAVKIILEMCFRTSDFIRAISEAPLTFANPSYKDPWM